MNNDALNYLLAGLLFGMIFWAWALEQGKVHWPKANLSVDEEFWLGIIIIIVVAIVALVAISIR